jgi:hypothetical protein
MTTHRPAFLLGANIDAVDGDSDSGSSPEDSSDAPDGPAAANLSVLLADRLDRHDRVHRGTVRLA